MNKDCIGLRGDLRLSLVMDIENFHRLQPLELQMLLDADRATFLHDVVGIWNHYDRQNGTITGGFVARTASSNHHPDPVVLAYIEEGLGG